ncbi:MAG: hypothetical protein Fur0037_22600 [Planctomycetota bacterium]
MAAAPEPRNEELHTAPRAGDPPSRIETAARWLWVALFAGIAARIALQADPARNNVYLKVFAPAAEAFRSGQALYSLEGGFRYPPLAAAALWPFAASGEVLGSILWRLANAIPLWLGVRACFRAGFPFPLRSRERGVFLILLAVSEVVSLNNGQPNVLISGLLLLSAAGAATGRALGPAASIAVAAAVKVYPLAYGLVLGVLRARIWLPLAALVAACGLLPFAIRDEAYVAAQYRDLFDLLASEDRTADLANAYRDFRLLAAAAGLPLPPGVFPALQALSGAGIAGLAFWARRRGGSIEALAWKSFSLTMCWFMLFGPATEKSTYALLGPTLAFSAILAWRSGGLAARCSWTLANALVVLAHVAEPGRAVQAAHPWTRCALPAAALIAAFAALGETRRGRRDAR